MIELSPWPRILLIVFCLIAALWDLKSRRIPNWLTLSGLAGGVALNAALYGMAGIKTAGSGLGVAAIIALPLYMLRGLGGGDVKMMAAAGAIVGAKNFLLIFIVNAVLGGAVALAMILWKGRLRRTLSNVAAILREMAHLRAPHQGREELDIGNAEALTLPRAPVFAAAVFLLLLV